MPTAKARQKTCDQVVALACTRTGTGEFQEALCFGGCYAFDAAQDNFQCLPDCSSRVGSVDIATRLDMGGMGNGCPYQFENAGSCLTGGRIDASENDGVGCNYDARFS